MDRIDRRATLAMLGAAAVAASCPGAALAATAGPFMMWRDPGCGCCLDWARRIEAAFGRRLAVVEAPDMVAIKRARGVPEALRSCHTALIASLVIEGHVPPADIKRLIASRDASIRGLAVPGMPVGSPGMDVGHELRVPYHVYAFGPGHRPSIFASHNQG